MKIYRDVLDEIKKAATLDYEIGGAIGVDVDSGIISRAFVDSRSPPNKYTYMPNVSLINKVVKSWKNETFIGLFHSHLSNNQNSLSARDKNYICEIMKAMPLNVEYLYFPLLVLPENRIYGFKAIRTSKNQILICDESVDII